MHQPERIRGPARAPATDLLGDDRGASCSPIWPLPQDVAHLRRDPRFHRLTEHLHRLGPAAVKRLEARDWPPTMWGLSA
jgi:hypothetical protein